MVEQALQHTGEQRLHAGMLANGDGQVVQDGQNGVRVHEDCEIRHQGIATKVAL